MSNMTGENIVNFYRKSCAVIITYNKVPELSVILEAVARKEIDALFICDNSNREDILSGVESQITEDLKSFVRIVRNGANLGISKGFNIAFRIGQEEGFYYFYLLDDDAKISGHLFSIEREYYEQIEKTGEKIGVICPLVSNNYEDLDSQLGNIPTISTIQGFISSGALLSAATLKIIGGYNESFFLEHADIEFSYRLTREGLKIFRVNRVLVVQQFGNNLETRGIVGMAFKFYWSTLNYFLITKLNLSNDIQPIPTYYSPERELVIERSRKRLYRISRSQPDYVKPNVIRYFIRYCIGSIKMMVREIFLFLIFNDSRYLKVIVTE